MEIKGILVVSTEDYELLNSIRFEKLINPCEICGMNSATCCGCPKYTEYQKALKPFKEANLEEMVTQLATLQELCHEVMDSYRTLANLCNVTASELERIGFDTCKIDILTEASKLLGKTPNQVIASKSETDTNMDIF